MERVIENAKIALKLIKLLMISKIENSLLLPLKANKFNIFTGFAT